MRTDPLEQIVREITSLRREIAELREEVRTAVDAGRTVSEVRIPRLPGQRAMI